MSQLYCTFNILWVSFLFVKELLYEFLRVGSQGIPWWSRCWDSMLSLLRAQVQCVVRELRTQNLHSTARKNWFPKSAEGTDPSKVVIYIRRKSLLLKIIFQKRVSLLVVLVSIFPTSDESQTLTTKRMLLKNGSLISSNIIAC